MPNRLNSVTYLFSAGPPRQIFTLGLWSLSSRPVLKILKGFMVNATQGWGNAAFSSVLIYGCVWREECCFVSLCSLSHPDHSSISPPQLTHRAYSDPWISLSSLLYFLGPAVYLSGKTPPHPTPARTLCSGRGRL